MRKILIATLVIGFTTTAQAETILASVNGMVCAFCATGIEKSFQKQSVVESVNVDLDKKLVTLRTKPNQTLDDATVTKIITNAGYKVVGIARK